MEYFKYIKQHQKSNLYFLLGHIYTLKNKKKLAEKMYLQSFRYKFTFAALELGIIYFNAKKYAKSHKYIDIVLKTNANATAMFYKALLLLQDAERNTDLDSTSRLLLQKQSENLFLDIVLNTDLTTENCSIWDLEYAFKSLYFLGTKLSSNTETRVRYLDTALGLFNERLWPNEHATAFILDIIIQLYHATTTDREFFYIIEKHEPYNRSIKAVVQYLRQKPEIQYFEAALSTSHAASGAGTGAGAVCIVCMDANKKYLLKGVVCMHSYCKDCFIKLLKCPLCQKNLVPT
jgi:tetratricopeptide (TPR) repeat protein